MAENRRLLDIWIVETNTAYKAVPFETVANWLQQGRLLPRIAFGPVARRTGIASTVLRRSLPICRKPSRKASKTRRRPWNRSKPSFPGVIPATTRKTTRT